MNTKLNRISCECVNNSLISIITDIKYHKLATLSSKRPRENGNCLDKTCNIEVRHVSVGDEYTQKGNHRRENVIITVIPILNKCMNPE